MKILITGGQGYVGNYLAKACLEKGWEVVTLDTGHTSKPYGLNGVVRLKGTTTNHDLITRAMHGVDLVYHLASRRDWSNEYRQPLRIITNNVIGTATVLAMARRVGVAGLIFVSTAEVYGNLVPATETDSCVPVTMYGASMAASEDLCRGFYGLGVEVSIARLANVWGGCIGEGIINKLVTCKPKLVGDGDQTRDFIHVSDAVDALMAMRLWDPAIYNVGTGEEVAINGLWSILRNEEPEYENIIHPEVYRYCLDMTHTKQSTGWEAKLKISELTKQDIINNCQE